MQLHKENRKLHAKKLKSIQVYLSPKLRWEVYRKFDSSHFGGADKGETIKIIKTHWKHQIVFQ